MPRVGLTREILVEKAAQVANEQGISNVNIKTLAEYIGIKPPSLYKYIDGIEELFEEMMLHGWKLLEEQLYKDVIGKSGDDAVKAMCDAYYTFAVNNPGVFASMENYNRYSSEKTREATQGICKITSKIFSAYKLTNEQMMHLVRTFRGFLQGYMMLVVNGSFGDKLPVKDSFDLSVDILVNGITDIARENEE